MQWPLMVTALCVASCQWLPASVGDDGCDPSPSPSFTIHQDSGDNEFSVKIRGLEVLRHNKSMPMMYVGNGQDTVTEVSGNFFLSTYLEERLALRNSQVVNTLGTTYVTMSWANYSVKVSLTEDGATPLVVTVVKTSQNFNRLWLRLPATPGERVYGGGEQFTYLDLRGRVFPVWVREQGVGRNKSTITTFYADQLGKAGGDYYTTYFPQSTWITSRSYFLHYTGSTYAEMDFRHPQFLEMLITGDVELKEWRLQVQPSMKKLVSCLTKYLSRPKPLPTWLYEGAILGVQGGTQQMLSRLEAAQKAGISVRGMWIQDWSGTKRTPFGDRVFWNWQWNQQHYPGLNDTIVKLKKSGVRVLAYINPNLDSLGPLFAVANNSGYLVKNVKGQPYLVEFGTFLCGIVDLTNPEAFTWYKDDVVKGNMLQLGLGGWMADFGEYLPYDAVLHAGDASRVHNEWPRLWAELNQRAVAEMGEMASDVVFFSRSGFTGISNASMLMWAGDQNVDWSMSDGAASTVPAALSMGLSGMGLTHFDIGGYTTYILPAVKMTRSSERLLRSAEHAVFGPVFRTHEGNIPRANVQYYSSQYMMQCFKRLVDMFVTLKPYHQHVVNVTALTGIPAQRPLFLGYPNDSDSYAVQYEYMYGDDLLVAPVYLPNRTTWTVYLPLAASHTWVYLWNSSMVLTGGGEVVVPTLVGQPPVFYRNDSVFVDAFVKIGNMTLVPPPPLPPHSPTSSPSPCSGYINGSASIIPSTVLVSQGIVLLLGLLTFLLP